MPRVPTKPFLLLSMLPVVQACVAAPLTLATQSAGCSSLIPPAWQSGVDPAPLPDGNTVADWVAFGDAQTGKLDQANDRTSTVIGIVSRCEDRDAAAVKAATRRKFLGVF